MYFLKQCPKCHGDLVTDSDQYGDFLSCMQCGLCQDVQADQKGSTVIGMAPSVSSVAAVLSREGYRTSVPQPASRRLAVSAH